MCGITGFLTKTAIDPSAILEAMARNLVHRGPDDFGVWSNEYKGVFVAHRRLSIQDISSAGHQPMTSRSGRFTMVFNGEIYNHLNLRKQLHFTMWRGHSDTETLVEGFSEWGIEETIKKTVGMFAVAVWDEQENQLSLIRDRMGEKPLYYGIQNDTIFFGSELKALRAHPLWQGEIERKALALFLRHNYIPSPWTIYSNVFKLIPGTILTIGWNTEIGSKLSEPLPYWDPVQSAVGGQRQIFKGKEVDAINELDTLLHQAIKGQMLSDVPLGAFLSGGIDSSLIVSIMQAQSKKQIKTFSIGFNNPRFDETPFARTIAHHLSTEHTELYVNEQEAQAVIPELPQIWDEPFGDSSQIPTLVLSRLTKKYVTVSLSGDGGDELFCGYNRYYRCKLLWEKLRYAPLPVRHAISKSILSIPPAALNAFGLFLNGRLGGKFGDKMNKLAVPIASRDFYQFYQSFTSHWFWPDKIVIGGTEPMTIFTDNSCSGITDDFGKMMLIDLRMYLPDDILVKVDRAAMATSLETRVPFLDHRIVEFAHQLPLSLKYQNLQSKYILRKLLERYVPRNLFDRPKKGFGVPLSAWLRGPLRDWAESLLSEERLRRDGFFNVEPIRTAWIEHVTGRREWHYKIWDILMFQAWYDQQKVT